MGSKDIGACTYLRHVLEPCREAEAQEAGSAGAKSTRKVPAKRPNSAQTALGMAGQRDQSQWVTVISISHSSVTSPTSADLVN